MANPLLRPALPCSKQKRLEALRKDMPSDVDVSIDPTVSDSSKLPAESQYTLKRIPAD